VVADATGAVAPGAKVELTERSTNPVRRAATAEKLVNTENGVRGDVVVPEEILQMPRKPGAV
jgi:hypothetical protein